MIKRVEKVLMKEKPDIRLVYGDTNSTLAGALAAIKLHIPVAHIEAGLRSFNKKMPEEINRIITDRISDILFCPTKTAVQNLKKEGIEKGVFLVGDVMYDAILLSIKTAERKWKKGGFEKIKMINSKEIKIGELAPKRYALATVHRAENTDDPNRLKNIFVALNEIAEKMFDAVIVPLHPRTQKALRKIKIKLSQKVLIIPPLSYLDMLIFEKNSALILTDSGGVQKEAYFLRIPCITLRDETEWIELVETGWNKLAGTEPDRIFRAVEEMSSNFRPKKKSEEIFGSGDSAKKIVDILTSFLNLNAKTSDQ